MPEGEAGGVPANGHQPRGGQTVPAAPAKSTREIAREALEAAGLTTPPKSQGPRRLILFSIVVLVVLVILVVGSLVVLDHLKIRTTPTTTSTSTTLPATATTSSARRGGHVAASIASAIPVTRTTPSCVAHQVLWAATTRTCLHRSMAARE